jgi:hypothetical protein
MSSQGIAFSPPKGTPPKPTLLDGQHRLFAIEESKRGIWVSLTVNQAEESQKYLDSHTVRKVKDIVNLSGIDITATDHQIGLATRACMGVRSTMLMTRGEAVEFYSEHKDAIHFVTDEVFQKRKRQHVMPSPVGAVMVRAFYHVEHPLLLRMGEVILSGISMEEREGPIILLRNWLLAGGRDNNVLGQRISRQVLVYMKMQRALVAFINSEKIKILYPMREEAFMLPGEAPHRADAGKNRARKDPPAGNGHAQLPA